SEHKPEAVKPLADVKAQVSDIVKHTKAEQQAKLDADKLLTALRQAILDGRLSAGSKIPSSRALAEMMAISRNSVIAGFDRLM
ncbi:GntR family transcriptional regulator, partial [Klebsiella michiganensis]|uniref:GntR family transcriptional regulator n=1 Tax=Klebsiella michiganensis TaxID=1134687 RepID=UPI001E4B7880